MTLKEANCEVERLNNDLNKMLRDKELLEVITDPKSTDYTKVVVDGGKRSNVLEVYILKQEVARWKDLDEKIKRKQCEINNLMNWIDNELKILKKYNQLEQLIVYYKEIDIKEYTWYQIAAKVNYSKDYCRKVYSKYKKKKKNKKVDHL